ncbi:unnamed protein product [Adineta steineri]|uniref:Uncharacterized protein n=1 Tax=Adineta steineri TaxID=433720 RepID=A0A815GDM6_9BILA|nr:unnamed protein product [Adineta steineri]
MDLRLIGKYIDEDINIAIHSIWSGIALIILHSVVYGERDIQPVVVNSLAHDIGLSGDPLQNPFHDPDIPAPSKTNRPISVKSSSKLTIVNY